MACRCAPSLVQLRSEVNAMWPDRDKASDGCCGDAAHAARKSDHNPGADGYAEAEDIDEDIVENMGDQELWTLGLHLLSDTRTKYLIYEKQLLYPDGTIKPYSGINDHKHHLHISIKPVAVHDTRPWLTGFALEDDMPLSMDDPIVKALSDQIGALTYGVVPDGGFTGKGEVTLRCRQITSPDALVAMIRAAVPAGEGGMVSLDDVEQVVRDIFLDAGTG